MGFDRNTPYNKLPLLPPKYDLETPAILRLVVKATRAVAELKGLGSSLPNQSILIDSVVLQEAKASSEIENIVTTNDALFTAASKDDQTTDPHAKEVLRYRKALWAGYDLIRKKPLNKVVLEKVGKELLQRKTILRTQPGTTLANPATGQVFYTPPHGKARLLDLLSNLETYLHDKRGVDPLIRMCVAHYQFEAIHPYIDGNGRTGRILNILYLVDQKLLDIPVLFLSQYIIDHKQKYYSLIRNVSEKSDWKPWVTFMLEAVSNTATATTAKIRSIMQLLEDTIVLAKERLPDRVYSKELIEALFHLPYIRITNLVDAGLAKRQTAGDYLSELSKAGILEEKKSGREKIFINTKLFNLLKD